LPIGFAVARFARAWIETEAKRTDAKANLGRPLRAGVD